MTSAANSARLATLEERQAARRARSSQRDDDQVVHDETMAKIRETPSGIQALQAYEAAMQASDGNIQGALQSEAGRDAVGRFGATYIRSGAHVDDEPKQRERSNR